MVECSGEKRVDKQDNELSRFIALFFLIPFSLFYYLITEYVVIKLYLLHYYFYYKE